MWGLKVTGVGESAPDHYAGAMPPTLPPSGSVRSAVVVNAAIRALVVGAQGREWRQAERALYRLLVDEWVAAEGDVTEAA